MVHVATGNALDVVFDYDSDGVKRLLGLSRHGDREIILLPDPRGLLDVLAVVINECEVSRMEHTPPAAER